jgi:hypothetical protein
VQLRQQQRVALPQAAAAGVLGAQAKAVAMAQQLQASLPRPLAPQQQVRPTSWGCHCSQCLWRVQGLVAGQCNCAPCVVF